ncbi:MULTISPECIES: PIN domain-containing protein [Burkholderia]|jgi:predicted nucleic-acid-binding protein|uniref:PIN domain-containing protein n=1 Tax=Burkholderia TaxID=32008 RepID=UPI00086DB8C2|nr:MULTISPECIES: type II toxin-antitoxin system VapC family toxin [Burkholderia]MBR8393168.1 type II toxin-antitoxin system VapC family toxin [Burkholderia cenocepacia]MBR8470720.1 type II toxin-antitoxin system VapC family toxin [Burkholderia cenocepacia]MBR8493532.1 type II toxin-antitoxin system VapC family toxin [Burkholderia cenocepacia]MDO5923295.1 type II toxin-antitoxin system VapC family toxin [Burkholderia cenocepacia]ODN62927.1 twitching motility protein PilT [Burkholderia cenocepac
MIGLDTNVLVRYFAQDDEIQSKKATALMESLSPERPGYVSQVALIEVVWVLGRCYGVEREQMKDIVESMIGTRELVVESADTVRKALRVLASSKADFADCLIERSGHVAECEYTATFDVSASKVAGMQLIK